MRLLPRWRLVFSLCLVSPFPSKELRPCRWKCTFAPPAFLISRMLFYMFGLGRKHLKVCRMVVQLISVNVMDYLALLQWSAKLRFRNPAMLVPAEKFSVRFSFTAAPHCKAALDA
jgi:hypothetical protein